MTQLASGMTSSHFTASSSTSTVKPFHALAPSQNRLPHSVRSQLYDLLPLPRHALFHVRLTIHQLWNVPLVSGDFCVRWKFHKVHSVRGNGTSKKKGRGKSRGRERAPGLGEDADNLGSNHSNGSELLLPSGASMVSLHSEGSSSNAPSPRQSTFPLPGMSNIDENGIDFSSESRGRTEYVPLQEHNVKWGHTVNVAVQLAVHRETMDLQASELKLIVEQVRRLSHCRFTPIKRIFMSSYQCTATRTHRNSHAWVSCP